MAFVPQLQGSWLRNVHSGGEMRLLGLGARRLNEQCIVAGHCNASYEIQELLEVQLPITVDIKPLHHSVHNSRVLLILCEGSQLGVHESQEFLLGELEVVSFTPCIPLEDSQQ